MSEHETTTLHERAGAPPLGAELGLRIHHVGVAVRSIERALRYYVDVFGFRRITETIDVDPEHVKVCFLEDRDGVRIELVEGVGDESPVRELLRRPGAGTYHICYQVSDLERAVRELKERGFRPFRRFEVNTSGPRRFAFLLTPDRQLFELCEVADSRETT
jgi:methylmalonyl-CoA/ethylmalonyl-CoA epimerase